MSRTLSVSACLRASLLLAGAAVLLTGCAGGAAPASRPAAAVRSGPSASLSPDGTPGDQAAATGTATVATDTAAFVPAAASPSADPPPVATPLPASTPPGDRSVRPGSPSPRFSPAMAYDGSEHDVLLFGGESGATFLSDTWSWNGQRWTQLHPAHSPSPRAWAEMAFDPRHDQMVLFGGIGAASPTLTDTWLWNGDDWMRAAPAFNPASTREEGITFFSGTGTVLMFSGASFGPDHVYSWDGANWTDLPFTGGPPASAFQGGFSVDPKRQVVVLLAYDVNQTTLQHWEFDGRTWTHRALTTPPTRSLVQTATDDRTDTSVMFGGTGHNDTWTWDGARWTRQNPVHSPSVRSSTGPMPGMAFDVARGKVVVFGGMDYSTNRLLNDTWTWDGEDWSES